MGQSKGFRPVFFFLLMIPLACPAAQDQPPWLQPEVLKAAAGIALTEAKLPLFQAALTNLVNNQTLSTNKLLRQNNVVDLDRKLKTSTNRQFKKMDREMSGFLSATQLPSYRIYRNALKRQLTKNTIMRSASSDDSIKETAKTLRQTATQHH